MLEEHQRYLYRCVHDRRCCLGAAVAGATRLFHTEHLRRYAHNFGVRGADACHFACVQPGPARSLADGQEHGGLHVFPILLGIDEDIRDEGDARRDRRSHCCLFRDTGGKPGGAQEHGRPRGGREPVPAVRRDRLPDRGAPRVPRREGGRSARVLRQLLGAGGGPLGGAERCEAPLRQLHGGRGRRGLPGALLHARADDADGHRLALRRHLHHRGRFHAERQAAGARSLHLLRGGLP
mmetsp:Transcript_50878/g.142023  ORF Transcript_50878/g.142023 Transcript_50878/m.142023 type:complete len:237 (-) Transcript_50878:478-1188(-)